MAGDSKRDAYTLLKRTVFVLFVFTVIAVIGFIYARNTVERQLVQAQEQVEEQNRQRQETHEQWIREQAAAQNQQPEEGWPQPEPEGWQIVDLSSFDVKSGSTEEFEREALEAGGLMLVNRWHYLPGDFTDERFQDGDELVSIMSQSSADGFYVESADRSVRLLQPAYEHLMEMLRAASASGLENYMINEAYRTYEKQESHFLNEQAKYENRFTGEVLIEKARESVAVPGTSDYQTGLSINPKRYKKGDSEFNKVSFSETEHFAWLYNHSWEHGYVFRFPISGYPTANTTDKAWKTGIKNRMMVFRYVGIAPATVMHQNDFCLEEFIEYMIQHPHIAVYRDGELQYELYRMPYSGGSATVRVPEGAEADASMDNMGGVIVSLYY